MKYFMYVLSGFFTLICAVGYIVWNTFIFVLGSIIIMAVITSTKAHATEDVRGTLVAEDYSQLVLGRGSLCALDKQLCNTDKRDIYRLYYDVYEVPITLNLSTKKVLRYKRFEVVRKCITVVDFMSREQLVCKFENGYDEGTIPQFQKRNSTGR